MRNSSMVFLMVSVIALKGSINGLSGSRTLGTTGHRLQPKILDTTDSLQRQIVGEPYTLDQIKPHHSRLKRRGHQPTKN
jgi:hypothetical protein